MAPRGVGANQNLQIIFLKLQKIFFLWKILKNCNINRFLEAFMAPKGVRANQNLMIKLLCNKKVFFKGKC